MHDQLLDLARTVATRCERLGADEVCVTATHGTASTIRRRAGKVEQATEETSRSVSVALMLDGRWSSHETSDLRPDAIGSFLARALDATRMIEPDPDRRLAPAELCGRGASDEALDLVDPSLAARSPADRSADAEMLEAAVRARELPGLISASVIVSDGLTTSARVQSNGFADATSGGWTVRGAQVSLEEPSGKRPEAYAYYSARHAADLPTDEEIAAETARRADAQRGMAPIPSAVCPMLLANRTAGQILGLLLAPLNGASIQQQRSCLAGRRGERIGSDVLTLVDDPTLPRGLASRPWDGDALAARKRTIVEAGVLREYYLSVYYARKLGETPTSAGRSNWVLPPGERPWKELARELPRAILVEGFLGGNANPVTGDFSYGIRGQLVERGEIVRPISEMNVAGNLLGLFDRLVAAADDPWRFGSVLSPTLLFDAVAFSGT